MSEDKAYIVPKIDAFCAYSAIMISIILGHKLFLLRELDRSERTFDVGGYSDESSKV